MTNRVEDVEQIPAGNLIVVGTDVVEGAVYREYHCPDGHVMLVAMYEDADPPARWTCPRCSRAAIHREAARPLPPIPPPVRAADPALHRPAREGAWYTLHHRKSLHARRSHPEMEALLRERLRLLRKARADTS